MRTKKPPGTPLQISALIPDAENGLFSRFIFYYINFKLECLDVFACIDGSTLDEIFDDIGWSFAHVYQDLEGMPEMEFQFTPNQQHAFNDYYTSLQAELHSLFGDDIIASVHRLGLITFRIAMAIARVLIRHTIRVYQELSSAELSKPAAEGTKRKEQFLSSLPGMFTTQAFKEWPPASTSPSPQPSTTSANGARKAYSPASSRATTSATTNQLKNPPKSPQQ